MTPSSSAPPTPPPTLTPTPSRASGFLGRGPLFWLGLTLVSALIIAALTLSEAIANEAVILILTIAPVLMVVATFRAMLNTGRAMSNTSGSRDPDCAQTGVAQQAYIKRVAAFTSLYLATFAALTALDDAQSVPVAAHYVIAILPGLAIIGVFWAVGRLIVEETDEFLRMLTVRQTLIASAITLSAATVWGFLESADLVPHIDAYWYAVVWFLGLFAGALVNRIEHGTWGAV